jgi:hypothetical protein
MQMGELSQDEIDKLSTRILIDWYKNVDAKLKSALLRQKINLTGNLKDSIYGEINAAGQDMHAQLRLHFADYGRVKDMKVRYHGKGPPFEEILKFVQKVGIDKFKYVPGYPKGVFPVGRAGDGQRIAMNRIAWGIVKSRTLPKNADKKYGKKWYAKNFFSEIPNLVSALLGKTKELTVAEIIQNLKQEK